MTIRNFDDQFDKYFFFTFFLNLRRPVRWALPLQIAKKKSKIGWKFEKLEIYWKIVIFRAKMAYFCWRVRGDAFIFGEKGSKIKNSKFNIFWVNFFRWSRIWPPKFPKLHTCTSKCIWILENSKIWKFIFFLILKT